MVITLTGLLQQEENRLVYYYSAWIFRIKITIDADQVDENLSYFPVYVDLSDITDTYDFWDTVQADGGDLLVTKTDGTTRQSLEFVSITTSTGNEAGEIWFKADNISSTEDTDFYLYYGNDSEEQPAVGASYGKYDVWSNGYVGVFHLGASIDDTSSGITGTNNGTAEEDYNSTDR